MECSSLWSGILALSIGIFPFVHPFTMIAMTGWIIALLVFMSGATSLLMYISSVERSLWYSLQNVPSTISGIVLLSSSAISLSSAVITIAVYRTLISGILRLIGGFQMRRAGFYDTNRFLSSTVLAIPLRFFLLFNPTLSTIFIGCLTGLLSMTVGVLGIAFSFRI